MAATDRREHGQFFTPLPVARFMARLAKPLGGARRLLDPGAGPGVLACALAETLPRQRTPVHLDAYELDPRLADLCHASLSHARDWLARKGVQLSFTVHAKDFVRHNALYLTNGLFPLELGEAYDLAILNPPYFKLQKDDPRARAAFEVVHGHPNIYALFMAITASLLAPGGTMVSITPRSFTAGDYFRRFRQRFFSTVVPEAIHLFDSRQDAFRKDAVLQENVILAARRRDPHRDDVVAVTRSAGAAGLARPSRRSVPLASVVDGRSEEALLHIPVEKTDEAVLDFVRNWPETLASLGLAVSTGPVVAFRARELLLTEPSEAQRWAPLVWLNHVRPMKIDWPLARSRKPQFIRTDASARKLLVPNASYVLLRRFSAKEEERRVVAAPLFAGELPGEMLGLENHLNYVYRPGGSLSREETLGLAALLGSRLLDRYFRVSNGNTQVNATELRALHLPSLARIQKLGTALALADEGADLDAITSRALGVPSEFTNP